MCTSCVTFTANTCDQCGHHAYTMWGNHQLKRLLTLCAHHDRENELSLTADGWERTIDNRHLLAPA